MLHKTISTPSDWPVHTISPNQLKCMDPLDDHVVLWHTKALGDRPKQMIDQLFCSEMTSTQITVHACQPYTPTKDTESAFTQLTQYLDGKPYDDLSLNDLKPLLHTYQQSLGVGSVIHLYDRPDVNQAVLQPTDPSTQELIQSHGYEKYALISQAQLSAYLFIPNRDIAITPPHSHHSKRAITSTWGLNETSVPLPKHIQKMLTSHLSHL